VKEQTRIKEIKQGMCHTVTSAIYTKRYLKAKERMMESQIFQHAKI
jgi:hypothetical protein